MKVELFKMVGQFYIIPTIKITYDRTLNGDLEIQLCWFFGGVSFMF